MMRILLIGILMMIVSPDNIDTTLFHDRAVDGVRELHDIVYGHADGHWTESPGIETDFKKAVKDRYKDCFSSRMLDLKLDLYLPDGGTDTLRPLVIFIHGGSFYMGNKSEPAYRDFGRFFAAKGYVAACVNYRLGFTFGHKHMHQAEYLALQDVRAAVRFLCGNSGEYGIDTGKVFLAGSSAGGILALHLAFMNADNRQRTVFSGRKYDRIPPTQTSGGDASDTIPCTVKAIGNMWGAVYDPVILENAVTGVISFYGEKDPMVPPEQGLPMINAPKGMVRYITDYMYGPRFINEAILKAGQKAEAVGFACEGHAINTSPPDKVPNDIQLEIRRRMADFFEQYL